MIPAENPNEAQRKRVLVRLAINDSKLPIPVLKPAKRVKANASRTCCVSMLPEIQTYSSGIKERSSS